MKFLFAKELLLKGLFENVLTVKLILKGLIVTGLFVLRELCGNKFST